MKKTLFALAAVGAVIVFSAPVVAVTLRGPGNGTHLTSYGLAHAPNFKLTLSQSTYLPSLPIKVSWSGWTGALAEMWISPAKAPLTVASIDPDNQLIGGAAGSVTFPSLPTGEYQVRVLYGGTHPRQFIATHDFRVSAQAAPTPQANRAAAGGGGHLHLTRYGQRLTPHLKLSMAHQSWASYLPITVAWSGFPKYGNEWIWIDPASKPMSRRSRSLDAKPEMFSQGTQTFSGLPPGRYQVRVLLTSVTPNQFVATYDFTVSQTGYRPSPNPAYSNDNPNRGSVNPARRFYGRNEPITVHWSGFDPNDRIEIWISPKGAPLHLDVSRTTYFYAHGPSGTHAFVNPAAVPDRAYELQWWNAEVPGQGSQPTPADIHVGGTFQVVGRGVTSAASAAEGPGPTAGRYSCYNYGFNGVAFWDGVTIDILDGKRYTTEGAHFTGHYRFVPHGGRIIYTSGKLKGLESWYKADHSGKAIYVTFHDGKGHNTAVCGQIGPKR